MATALKPTEAKEAAARLVYQQQAKEREAKQLQIDLNDNCDSETTYQPNLPALPDDYVEQLKKTALAFGRSDIGRKLTNLGWNQTTLSEGKNWKTAKHKTDFPFWVELVWDGYEVVAANNQMIVFMKNNYDKYGMVLIWYGEGSYLTMPALVMDHKIIRYKLKKEEQ